MQILSITDQKGCRSGGWSGNSGRTYHLELLVVTDDPLMGSRAVLKGLGLRNGDFYRWPLRTTANEWDYGSFVQGVDIKEAAEDGKQWRISLDYGPYDWTGQGGATAEASAEGMFDPMAVPPQVRSGSAKFERVCTKDAKAKPVVNSVGDPFDPPIKRDDSRPTITVVRNEPKYDIALAQSFRDTVNDSDWQGFLTNTVKCSDITAQRQFHADYGYYWEVTYEFEIREWQLDAANNEIVSGWNEVVLDAGLRELASPGTYSGKLKPILLNGAPVTSSVLLNENGVYAGLGADPHYLQFQLYPLADFSKLNMPDDLLSSKSVPGAGGS